MEPSSVLIKDSQSFASCVNIAERNLNTNKPSGGGIAPTIFAVTIASYLAKKAIKANKKQSSEHSRFNYHPIDINLEEARDQSMGDDLNLLKATLHEIASDAKKLTELLKSISSKSKELMSTGLHLLGSIPVNDATTSVTHREEEFELSDIPGQRTVYKI